MIEEVQLLVLIDQITRVKVFVRIVNTDTTANKVLSSWPQYQVSSWQATLAVGCEETKFGVLDECRSVAVWLVDATLLFLFRCLEAERASYIRCS